MRAAAFKQSGGEGCRATEGVAVLVRHDMMAVIIMMSKWNSCLQNGRNAPDLSPCCRERPSQPRSGRRLSARVSLGSWERPALDPATSVRLTASVVSATSSSSAVATSSHAAASLPTQRGTPV